MPDRVFKRKIYDRMLEWKKQSDGASALLIQGARRIGKSTIAEEFAKNEYEAYIAIDFSIARPEIIDLFNDISDPDYFFLSLSSLTGKSLPQRKSVIIFDEVQLCPKARQAIKHLVKDGRYDYIETGSLLSIKKNISGIVIPSEETRLSMYPMDFEEFLWATGKDATFDLIRYSYQNLRPMSDAANRAMMRDFRLYMLVGGMPQAVDAYLSKNDFAYVDAIKRSILEIYTDDFRRIDNTGRASALFRAIPSQLSRNAMRYKVGSVIKDGRPSRLGEIFADMADSMTCCFSYHADDPSVGFALHTDVDYFKMYLCDTGLFVTLAFMDREYTDNEIYRKLLFDKLPADMGYVYENVVAQLLLSAGHSLHYYTFCKNEERPAAGAYEIDFLISHRDKICPVEVKSSGYTAHKSLDEFRAKYSSRIAQSYLIYTKDLRREADVIYLPVYMTGLL